jgi:hypothetical protein
MYYFANSHHMGEKACTVRRWFAAGSPLARRWFAAAARLSHSASAR